MMRCSLLKCLLWSWRSPIFFTSAQGWHLFQFCSVQAGVNKALPWPRHWDSHELLVHYNEQPLHQKDSFGRTGKFTSQRETREEGLGGKHFMIYEHTNAGISLSLSRKKKFTANINNYASFCTALCSWRRAFESIISSWCVCGRLGSGRAPRAGIFGELAAFVSLGV